MNQPATFAALLGQEKAKSLLRRAKSGNRLGHAYLFKGPAGVGKKTAAAAFAGFLNCQRPNAEDACGACPSCLKIASGNHPDFVTIAAEGSTIKINQIRDLKKVLSYPPFESPRRVVLLADIQLMGREAANSLLKTLEEPPAHTLLVLTADEAGEILPTILSRCQTIPFRPLAEEQVVAILRQCKPELALETAKTAAALSEGSPGRAANLLKQTLFAFRTTFLENLIRLSPEQPEAVRTVLRLAEQAAELKEDVGRLFELITLWLRDLMLLNVGREERIVNHDLTHLYRNCATKWNVDQIMQRLALLEKARKQLDRNCNRTMVCEVLFFNLL